MERTPEAIEKMVELLFADCLFDPEYMDKKWCKSQFRSALSLMSDSDWDWIVSKYQEEK